MSGAGGGVGSGEDKGVTMRVEVDVPKCVASGQCVMIAPDVFDQREEDGIVVLLDERPASELHADVRESAVVCPAAAIRVVEN
ncbi:ferredoxin [Streptomyces malaysiensis subsp. malaysiensis]|uniref:Ferredoxin n=3 Tax=Streptomyces TaxID=1883 RepID=A0A2J7Z9K3_STRMQ|nr:Ferredoxin-2 [Streptomyces malaysiensis]